jgi:AhpD family alkylhydroperoxidase
MDPQAQYDEAAEEKADSPRGGFRKRTITPLGFVAAVASIATEAPTLLRVWAMRGLDPGFRETLMLAVARFNDSKYCSWAHHEWALIEGVPEDELAHVEHLDRTHFDPKTWLAVSFVRALVAAEFGPVSKELMQDMQASYTAEEIEEITLVAKVMDALNVSSNTFDAFLSRMSGKPSRNGEVVHEAIMSAVFCCVLPPFLVFFSRSSNRSIDEVARRMVAYTLRMDAEGTDSEHGRAHPVDTRAACSSPA